MRVLILTPKRATAKANGARAVLGSQQPPTREHVRPDSTLPMQSDALRAQDGSRSGGSAEHLNPGVRLETRNDFSLSLRGASGDKAAERSHLFSSTLPWSIERCAPFLLW